MTKYLSKEEAAEILKKDLEERIVKKEKTDAFAVMNHDKRYGIDIRWEFYALKNGNLLEIVYESIPATYCNYKAMKAISAKCDIATALLKEGDYTGIVRKIATDIESGSVKGNAHVLLSITKEETDELQKNINKEYSKAKQELVKLGDVFKNEIEN